jgi:hypothetical protein
MGSIKVTTRRGGQCPPPLTPPSLPNSLPKIRAYKLSIVSLRFGFLSHFFPKELFRKKFDKNSSVAKHGGEGAGTAVSTKGGIHALSYAESAP